MSQHDFGLKITRCRSISTQQRQLLGRRTLYPATSVLLSLKSIYYSYELLLFYTHTCARPRSPARAALALLCSALPLTPVCHVVVVQCQQLCCWRWSRALIWQFCVAGGLFSCAAASRQLLSDVHMSLTSLFCTHVTLTLKLS